jgi:EAL domain-containing protein (putative c-di-GMP-specific phosphodiesterase class I)
MATFTEPRQRPGIGEDTALGVALALRDQDVPAMVADAVAARRLRLAYQPVVVAGDPSRTGFHEGLVRVLDPTGRIIPARDFVAAVEERETGREIDCVALAIGLESLARDPDLRLSVNLSARSMGYPRWMRVLRRGLSGREHLGQRLILEIAEASAMQMPEVVAAFMAEMRRHGISFALDGFGGGMSALRYFRELTFDIVKIDAQFSRGIEKNPDNQVLMAALMAVGRQFDMVTIAQGVETEAEAAWLRALGLDCLQGYHFGAPSLSPPGLATDQRATRGRSPLSPSRLKRG